MRRRPLYAVLLLLIVSPLLVVGAVASGSTDMAFADVVRALAGDGTPTTLTIVNDIRLPRVLAAFVAGGLLALAGALMQVLLRNPLADPYILGISGGAGSAVLLGILFGASAIWQGPLAFAGALASMFLVFALARDADSWSTTRLLLTGVVVAAGWGAVISFLLAVMPDQGLRAGLYWLMGDLSRAAAPDYAGVVLVAGVVVTWIFARDMNVLVRGEAFATTLGVNVRGLRLGAYLLASLLTASAVTVAGSVGFVGLIVPHLLRLVMGSDHRFLLPACVLAGGSLLVVADTLARLVIAPQQLPVGVLTAMIGVPLFLMLLRRGYRHAV